MFRTVIREHIPKRHCNFEQPIINNKAFDNTSKRIYGELHEVKMETAASKIGSGFNAADALPKFGKKNMIQEQEIMMKVAEEMRQREAEEDRKREQRFFDTTNKTSFFPQDYCKNTIGRRVMKNQDGKNVSFNERDEQLIVEHGTWRRLQKVDDQEIYNRIPKGDYTQTQPVTYWTHQQDRKNYYMSAAVGSNPFARTSGFTQSADQTKSVSGYYGNIDFEQESARVSFRKSVGKDLNIQNPYQGTENHVSNFSDITQRVVEICRQ